MMSIILAVALKLTIIVEDSKHGFVCDIDRTAFCLAYEVLADGPAEIDKAVAVAYITVR